jgi:hypothetical protein
MVTVTFVSIVTDAASSLRISPSNRRPSVIWTTSAPTPELINTAATARITALTARRMLDMAQPPCDNGIR